MKKIIYTTDFSENSVAALKYAYALSHLLQADLIALHVYNNGELFPGKSHKKKDREKHLKRLEEFCSSNLGEDFEKLDISAAAVKGSKIPSAIFEFVRDLDVYMLIMGACGTGTLKEVVMGSTTKEMLSLSNFPVLAVPSHLEYKPLSRVIYTSLFYKEDISHIYDLVQIVSPLDVEVVVVHVTDKEEMRATKRLEKFKKELEEKVSYEKMKYRLVFSDKVFEALKNFIEDTHPDMVVMLERKKKAELGNILYRDKVKRMQACIQAPILSFPVKS